MKEYHEVTGIDIQGDLLFLTIDGKARRFELNEISSVLQHASEKEKNTFEISPSGYGIHWPLLDEDLSIDGLLGVVHSPKEREKSI